MNFSTNRKALRDGLAAAGVIVSLLFVAVLGVVLSESIVRAQETGAAGSEVDFSGIYAVGVYRGVPTRVEEPDVYPFTEEGERAHNAYDRFTRDPRQLDDCAGDPVPELLWSANPMEIVQEEGRILMRFEENDTIRSIVMNGAGTAVDLVAG